MLWHYTTGAGRLALGRAGYLVPRHQPLLGAPLVWLTDLPVFDPAALAMTGLARLAFRYRVDHHPDAVPWPAWQARHPIDPHVAALYNDPPAQPDHWWVSEHGLPAMLDTPTPVVRRRLTPRSRR